MVVSIQFDSDIADLIDEMDYNGELKCILQGDKEWFKWYGVSSEDQLWYLNKRRELLQKYDQRNALLKALQVPILYH